MRKTGYLASLTNIPPLIFRFQFNPEILAEKKSFKYREDDNGFGQWGFDQTDAASGFFGTLAGLWKDVKEFGPRLTGVKPMLPVNGEARQISLDFQLQASEFPELADDPLFTRDSIEPDLAVLRSFMNPTLDITDLPDVFKGEFCWQKPPECALSYGDLSLTCVMTDMNIKVTAFSSEGTPLRAEVSITLKEQTFAASAIVDFVKRYINVARSYERAGGVQELGQDVLNITGIQSLIDVF